MFSIKLEKTAKKFVEKLKDKITAKRILNKIEKLKEEPFPKEATRVEKYKNEKVFRVRIGDYRILYYAAYDKSLVVIINIDKRPKAYNR